MLTAKKGISSLQIHRVIFGEHSGSDWRTSWYMCHRWRAAMRGEMYKLDGVVEVDETYVGGKDRNRHKGKKSADLRKAGKATGFAKVGVIGAIARKGNVVARVIGSYRCPHPLQLRGQGYQRATSGWSPRTRIRLTTTCGADCPTKPSTTVRMNGCAARCTQTRLNPSGRLLKRGILGTYHNVSKAYLPLYLNEFSFRFNNRENPDMFGAMVTTCGKRR